ncbi:MAG: aminotransferase class I/II-fold pyridoxal phosphate-dependent enzyme [Oscillospiraceae bacterium]
MIRFECDYGEGALPEILELMVKTNFEQTPGYSNDIYSEKAKELIKKACDAPAADVHILVGGTQANKTVIQSILRSHQGVLSAVTGHINVHETGTIEAGGHKVLPIASDDGKICAQQIEAAIIAHGGDEHCVQPGMVYISNPTENGTLYNKAELTAISKTCKKYDLPLFLDGARLGYGLAAPGNDLFLPDYARLCDVFYIGGTKVGALFGEAVVITNPSLKKDFRYHIKQNGGLLAKGRLLGLQFIGLFDEKQLYFKVSQQAIDLAMKLKKGFEEAGFSFRYDSPTNQQFPIIPDDKLSKLGEKYSYNFQEKYDDTHTVARFCTSWATKEEDVNALLADIKAL